MMLRGLRFQNFTTPFDRHSEAAVRLLRSRSWNRAVRRTASRMYVDDLIHTAPTSQHPRRSTAHIIGCGGHEHELRTSVGIVLEGRRSHIGESGIQPFQTLVHPDQHNPGLCGIATGRPLYLKAVLGNVKEESAVSMLDEFDNPRGPNRAPSV